LPICTAGSTAALIERSHREGVHSETDGRQRPLGVAALEDKWFQQAVVTILNQIYEEDFRGFSYVPARRSQHQALDALYVAITRKKVNWILDCDIRAFSIIYRTIAPKVRPTSRCRPPNSPLIQIWLKAGVLEEGEWKDTEMGYPAGIGGFAVACEHLSALRVRPLVDVWRRSVREAMSFSYGTPTTMFSDSSTWLTQTDF